MAVTKQAASVATTQPQGSGYGRKSAGNKGGVHTTVAVLLPYSTSASWALEGPNLLIGARSSCQAAAEQHLCAE